MKNKILLFFYLTLFLLFTTMPVLAKENVTIKTEGNNNKVFLTYSVEDTEIYGISSELKYDKKYIELEKCESKNNFTVTTNEDDTLIIVAESINSTKNEDIVTCTFKVEKANQNIIIQNINISNGTTLQEQTEPKIIELNEIVKINKGFNKLLIIPIVIIVILLIIAILKKTIKVEPIKFTLFLLTILLIPIKTFAIDNNYTNENLTTARNLILKKITYKEKDHKKLDLDNDNKITINDLIKIKINVNSPKITIDTTTTGTSNYYTSVTAKIKTESTEKIKEIKYCIGEGSCTPNKTYDNPSKEIEIKFEDHKNPQMLCVSATNDVNLSTTACDTKTYLVDSSEPTFEITSPTITITNDKTYDTKSNVKNVKYGVGGGSITCTNNTEIGTHTITCIAKGNNGLEAKKTYTLKINQKIYKILFVGNSKTYKNNIPEKVKLIAESNGYKIETTAITEGGKTLNYLAKNKTSELSKVENYDYLVLQEGTDTYYGKYNDFLNGAKAVINVVKNKNPNIKVFLRQTWVLAEKSNNNWYFSDKNISSAYQNAEKVAKEINATLIHDGKAFKKSTETYKSIILFYDDRHQTSAGAYLSAACIYKVIFNKSPVGTKYIADLNSTTANRLQNIAYQEG